MLADWLDWLDWVGNRVAWTVDDQLVETVLYCRYLGVERTVQW